MLEEGQMGPRRARSRKQTRTPGRRSRRASGPSPDVESAKGRIHACALRLFARYGYEGVGLQRIADDVGLHKSSLYHYYRGKLELADEVLDAVLERVLTLVQPLTDNDPPTLEALLAALDAVVDHFADEPEAARMILSVLLAPEDSDLNLPLRGSDHPAFGFFSILWSWLERAKHAGVIRPANTRQTLMNLVGVVLFYPAVASEISAVSGPEPFGPSARRHRRDELHRMLRGALEPR
jgi:AcrR family transcriptional regulator